MVDLGQLPFDFSMQSHSTFSNFITCEENLELVKNLQSNESLPEQFYFIWGEEGSGKSHLLQAYCQNNANAVYVPLKDFSKYGADILEGLENMDVVCLDDVEIILRDKDWEEGLFRFFNNSREQGKTLLMTSFAAPRNLEIKLADLASRMSWGVVYQLHELNDEQIKAALTLKVRESGIPLNEEVLDYVLLRSPRGMKALAQVVETLDKLSLAEKRRITIPFVKAMMAW